MSLQPQPAVSCARGIGAESWQRRHGGDHERKGRDEECHGGDHEREGRDHEREGREHEREGRVQERHGNKMVLEKAFSIGN